MRFGLCCGLHEVEAAVAAGYDYLELPLSGIAALDDVASLPGVPVEATNLFLPGSIKLFGPDQTPYAAYAWKALERAASLGVKVSVLGSGGARRAPSAGQEWENAFGRIAGELSGMAAAFGITLAPESLNRSETNVGNTLSDLAPRLAVGGVAYTADSYHVLFEWDADGRQDGPVAPSAAHWAQEVPFLPAHVHLGDLPRTACAPDDPMLGGFVERLRQLGYDGRVSLEINRESDVETLSTALKNMKELFG